MKASATAPSGQQWTRCGTSQQFWISWHGGLIRLGNGTMPGVNVIVEWTSPASMSVQGIALESSGSNQAIWRWQDTVGTSNLFYLTFIDKLFTTVYDVLKINSAV